MSSTSHDKSTASQVFHKERAQCPGKLERLEESTSLRVTTKIETTTACQQLNLIEVQARFLNSGLLFFFDLRNWVRPFKTLFGVCRLKEAVKLIGGLSVLYF